MILLLLQSKLINLHKVFKYKERMKNMLYKLGDLVDIAAALNIMRLTVAESKKRYSNKDFEYDFFHMRLADRNNSIIYRQSMGMGIRSTIATILSNQNKEKIISQVFSIIHIKDTNKLNPWYLCYLLNESDDVSKQCYSMLQGSVIARLFSRQLVEIKIPLPDIKMQNKIGSLYATTIYQNYLQIQKATLTMQGIMHNLHQITKGDI